MDHELLENSGFEELYRNSIVQEQRNEQLFTDLKHAREDSGEGLAVISMILNVPETDIRQLTTTDEGLHAYGLSMTMDFIQKYAQAVNATITYELGIVGGGTIISSKSMNSVIEAAERELEGTIINHAQHAKRMHLDVKDLEELLANADDMTVDLVGRYVNTACMTMTYRVRELD